MSDDKLKNDVEHGREESGKGKEDANEKVEGVKEVITEVEINIDYKDKWLRARADYDNLQKEVARQRGEWALYSEQQILEEFIPVYDNLAKALTTDFLTTDNTDTAKNIDSWKKGVEFIKKQFETVLKNHGVEPIKTVGEQFNPEFHEAVGEEKSAEFDSGVVVREVEAGYVMRGRVIKVAKVVVAK